MAEEKKNHKSKSSEGEKKKSKKKENKDKRHKKKDKKEEQYKSKEFVPSDSSDDEANREPLPPPPAPPPPPPTPPPRPSSPASPCASDDSRRSPTPDEQSGPLTPGGAATPPSPRSPRASPIPNESMVPTNKDEVSTEIPHPRRNLSADFEAASKESNMEGVVVTAPNISTVAVIDGIPLIKGMEDKAEEIAELRESQKKMGVNQPTWLHILLFIR